MCSTCEVDAAEVVCFCDYPLATLCQGQCLQKHRSSLGFHFEVPISVSPYVAKENFGACQHWLFGLRRAQLALRKNVATIETFEGEIKAAFGHIEREIAALKEKYKAAIEELKQTVAGMIEAAIGETTAQAFHSEPQFTCPLSEWIWWGANPANTGDLLLYRFSANTGDRETIGQLVYVELERLGTFLPELPLHLVSTQKTALQISSPLCSLSILPRIEVKLDLQSLMPAMLPRIVEKATAAIKEERKQLKFADLRLQPTDMRKPESPYGQNRLGLCPTCGRNTVNGNCDYCFARELSNQRPISASEPEFSSEKKAHLLDFPIIPSSQSPQHPDFNKLQEKPLDPRAQPLDESAPGEKASTAKALAMAAAARYQGHILEYCEITGAEGGKGEKAVRMKAESGNVCLTGVKRDNSQLRNEEEHKTAPREDATQRREGPLASGGLRKVEELVERPGLGAVTKRIRCAICQSPYSREDEAYFCPGACRCRRCAIEILVEVPADYTCKWCGGSFEPEVLRAANMGRKRCHVCGIAVDIAEMASGKCLICIKCVVLSNEREYFILPMIKGKCRLHPKTLFPIDTQYYKIVRERDLHFACCSFDYNERKVLHCGHTVCATHQKHLRFCRSCQAPVKLLQQYSS